MEHLIGTIYSQGESQCVCGLKHEECRLIAISVNQRSSKYVTISNSIFPSFFQVQIVILSCCGKHVQFLNIIKSMLYQFRRARTTCVIFYTLVQAVFFFLLAHELFYSIWPIQKRRVQCKKKAQGQRILKASHHLNFNTRIRGFVPRLPSKSSVISLTREDVQHALYPTYQPTRGCTSMLSFLFFLKQCSHGSSSSNLLEVYWLSLRRLYGEKN